MTATAHDQAKRTLTARPQLPVAWRVKPLKQQVHKIEEGRRP